MTTLSRARVGLAAGCCAAAALGALVSDAGASGSLHDGKYQCYQYSASSGYLYFGSVKISGSKYATGSSKGTYSLRGSTIRWTSGPYKRYKWSGKKVSSRKFKIIGKADHIEINCNR